MTALEKFFLGFALVVLAVGVVTPNGDPNVNALFAFPLFFLVIFTGMQVAKGRATRKALAKGVILVYQEPAPSCAFKVEREPVFPRTKEDYSRFQGALSELARWTDKENAKFPFIFYFQGCYTLVTSKEDWDNKGDKIRAKYRELL